YSLYVLQTGPPRILRKGLSHACLINLESPDIPEPFSGKLQVLDYCLVFCAESEPLHVDESDLPVLLQDNSNDRMVSLLSQVDSDVVIFHRYAWPKRFIRNLATHFSLAFRFRLVQILHVL